VLCVSPQGATIATDEITGNIVVARILKGGAADRSGKRVAMVTVLACCWQCREHRFSENQRTAVLGVFCPFPHRF